MTEADETQTVLLVEDNPGDARLVRALLAEAPGRRFRIEHAERLQDALLRLDAGGIDVVLLDLSLPDGHGAATVEAACARAGRVPVVVYTGFGDERKAAEAVSKGAESFVVKGRPGTGPLLSEILVHAVERRRVREIAREARRELAGAIDALSSALTRVPASDVARPQLDEAGAAARRALELLSRIS